MFGNVLFVVFSTLLASHVCKSDEAGDAEAALAQLRQITNEGLYGAFDKLLEMTANVDTVALDTKEDGIEAIKAMIEEANPDCAEALEKEAADEVATCVEKHAEMAIDYITKSSIYLIEEALTGGFFENKEIIRCGRADVDCLEKLTDSIKLRSEEVPELIVEKVEADSKTIDSHIDMIKACATSDIKVNVEKCTV